MVLWIIIVTFCTQISAKKILLPCNEIMQELCKTQNYVTTINPEPIPTKVNITIVSLEVLFVDEIHETVSLSMKVNLEWQDHRLSVNRSMDYIEK